MAARKKNELRQQFREALKKAVSGEQRFGIREDCRSELDRQWDLVVELLEELTHKKRGAQ